MSGTLNKVMLIGHLGDEVKIHRFEEILPIIEQSWWSIKWQASWRPGCPSCIDQWPEIKKVI